MGVAENSQSSEVDHKSCMSAVKLRGKGKGVSPGAVLAKASRWASAHGDKA